MADVIRLGVFFDGTGNNKDNDLAIGDGSQTNVAKIFDLYQQSNYQVFYKEGVGTRALTQAEIDSVKAGLSKRNDYYSSTEMALGIGAKDKVLEMMDTITNQIDQIKRSNPNAKIVVDVYGFSRGAAEARDFINMINTKYASLNGSMIGFVGLFDTVATVGLANEYNYNLNLNLNTYSAQQMVHLTVNDEFRANFPLQSFNNQHSKPRIAA
ncbi:MAG: DUF2235 domain-containing protein [Campylobacterota bacterium]